MTDQQSFNEIFNAVIEAIRATDQYSETTLSLWFSDMELKSITRTDAVLVTKSPFKRDVILRNYTKALEDAFQTVIGFPVKVEIRTQTAKNPMIDVLLTEPEFTVKEKPKTDSFLSNDSSASANQPEEGDELSYYSTVGDSKVVNYAKLSGGYPNEYTFENFIVGSSNKFAHAACFAVANDPAQGYNPLFIYAPPGLGKTHLLYAITNHVHKTRPRLNIVYVKGEEFTNQMIDSISKNKTAEFRNRYRHSDILLIDDIQFIAGKEATQEEFFHTFNDLYENQKQIILTSDRPPREIKLLEDRLKSRFEWGLLADIRPPDFELRIAILKHKAEHLHLTLPDEVLNYVAENLKSNVRQLEGAVKKIGAQSFLSGMPITIDLAISCISDLITPSEPINVTVEKIIDLVSRHYGVPVDEMKSKKRNASIANARHVSVYMIRKLTDMSLPAIAKIFNRDHTTIMSSLDKIEGEIKVNPTLDIEIRELIKSVRE